MANPHSQEHRLFNALKKLAVDGFVTGVTFHKLAEAADVGLRSLPRHIMRLERRGLIRCHNERGRGRINSYRILSDG